MDEFVAFSKASQDTLKIAMLSSDLPVNIILVGEKAVGKNHLAKLISPSAKVYEAVDLEDSLTRKSLDYNSFSEIIINNIHKIDSTKNLIQELENHSIKIIATTIEYKDSYDELFQVKIDVPPLREREEDVEFLTQKYINEAKRLFLIDEDIPSVKVDLSNNAISLKKSIYSSILFDSLDRESIMDLLENFFVKEFEHTTSYKELLKLFEIPLLRAGKKVFRSQLQMAKRFDINRNTLRKKLSENGLDD